MQPYRLGQIPRLARTLVTRVLDRRAAVSQKACLIDAADGSCEIDQIVWRRRTVSLVGHNSGRRVSFGLRGDVQKPIDHGPLDVDLDRPASSGALEIQDAGKEIGRIKQPPRWMELGARLRALPRVIYDCARETPAIISLLKSSDPSISAAIQRRLGVTDERPVTVLPSTLFEAVVIPKPCAVPTVVLPVFNGLEDLDALLNRLPGSCGTSHRLILVDDGSTDPRIAVRLLCHLRDHPETTTLIRRPRNEGFVAAANAGLRHALDESAGHVVLLNSDTLPPDNWLPRLLAPIEQDPGIASTTPFSNSAEILSIPAPASASNPTLDQIKKIDSVAAELSTRASSPDIPTGIGFCMGLNRSFLERIGLFDPAFGRGYGEEVDWCLKARQMGGRHVAACNLFVGHQGAASFGNAERTKGRRQADELINRRYPDFAATVRTWCHRDPLAPQRLVLSMAWASLVSEGPVPVFVAHSLGGGAEAALRVEIAAAFAGDCPIVILLRVGGPHLWRIEFITTESHQTADIRDGRQLAELLNVIPRMKLVYSCGVGGLDPMELPRRLLELARKAESFDIRIHDYLPISPSWTLLDDTGRFTGVPFPGTTDPAHQPVGGVSHEVWRGVWTDILALASEITVYSRSANALIAEAYPSCAGRIALRPHRLVHVPPKRPAGGANIGCLGSINEAKGAKVICDLAGRYRKRRLVVIGELDGRFSLPAPHVVHGKYDVTEIAELARKHDIGLWIIPSVWPETFSFTSHEALATGLPVVAFDLGAQGEAICAAVNGYPVPYDPDDTEALIDVIETAFGSQADISFRSAS